MTASSNAPQQPYEPPSEHLESGEPAESRGASTEGWSLDEVVRETLDAHGGGDRLAPEVRQAFVNVAGRHAAAETVDVSIVQELVDAVLSCRFERFRSQAELRMAASQRIAQTLWEDEPSRERLQRLWNSLREEV